MFLFMALSEQAGRRKEQAVRGLWGRQSVTQWPAWGNRGGLGTGGGRGHGLAAR